MTSSQTILIDTIKATDGIWQLCSEYDAMLIDVYKEALNEGVTLPPIAVFQVGDKRFLADGQHRLRAHKELGRTEINADLFHGTDCGDALSRSWIALSFARAKTEEFIQQRQKHDMLPKGKP
ncbi:MAG: ParB/RepB/Spo0J family partition protein [Pseudomonadota bacterium]|nr:ParB N-terminal domain-containing protein [Gammaproteobacteria bacterium]MDQ3581543.1 ParB/RepB/Spo0J family partition protein [Pseudomonadota bacterium]